MTTAPNVPDITGVLTQVSTEIEEASAQVRWAQGRLKDLETIRTGLIIAVEKYGLGDEQAAAQVLAVDGGEGETT